MKKAGKIALFLCFFVVFSAGAAAFPSVVKAVSSADLGVVNPGVLPSNPFYFLKKWKRDIKRAFTFGPVDQSRLELNILNERAAEIIRLAKIFPKDSAIIELASKKYLDNLINLPLEKETASLATVKMLKHLQLFEELGLTSISNALAIKMQNVFRDNLADPLEVRKHIKEQLTSDQQIFKELKMAETVDKSGVLELSKLKEDLLVDFVSEIKSGKSENEVLNLDGDFVSRIKVLDNIRSKITDTDAKNRINLLRQSIIKSAEEKGLINNSLIEGLILEINRDFGALNKLSESKLPLVLKLTKQAEFYKDQTQQAYNDKQYVSALGQATNALVSIEAALFFLDPGNNYYQEEIKLLKFDYDKLDNSSKELEERIINISDLVNNLQFGRPEDKIENLIFSVKLLLAEARHLSND